MECLSEGSRVSDMGGTGGFKAVPPGALLSISNVTCGGESRSLLNVKFNTQNKDF